MWGFPVVIALYWMYGMKKERNAATHIIRRAIDTDPDSICFAAAGGAFSSPNSGC